MSLDLIIFALYKYINIIESVFPIRARAVHRYIINILDISTKYSKDTYFQYHHYVWSRSFEGGTRVQGDDGWAN